MQLWFWFHSKQFRFCYIHIKLFQFWLPENRFCNFHLDLLQCCWNWNHIQLSTLFLELESPQVITWLKSAHWTQPNGCIRFVLQYVNIKYAVGRLFQKQIDVNTWSSLERNVHVFYTNTQCLCRQSRSKLL